MESKFKSVAFFGDMCLSGTAIAKAASEEAFNFRRALQGIVPETVAMVANLECAITSRDCGTPLKWATLKCAPDHAQVLDGLQIAILSNNHVSDFGEDGVRDTIDVLKMRSVNTLGFGSNLVEASQPAFLELQGGRLGIIALCCPTTNGENFATHSNAGICPLGMRILKDAIARALPHCDALIAYFHWGLEQVPDPVHDQLMLARIAIDAGADAVVGCHAHVVQSYEMYNGKWIFYGLGNILFDDVKIGWMTNTGQWADSIQEQSRENRQSIVPEFSIENRELRLVNTHYLEFNKKFNYSEISPSDMVIDLGHANQKLQKYVKYIYPLSYNDREPNFAASLRNGIMCYHHTDKSISISLKRVLVTRLRSLRWKIRHKMKSVLTRGFR